MAAEENARPTIRSSSARANRCSRPLDCSWSGPSLGAGTNRVSSDTPVSRRWSAPPMASRTASATQFALASCSNPVSTMVMRLRKPPS